jgi:hypothetical protein
VVVVIVVVVVAATGVIVVAKAVAICIGATAAEAIHASLPVILYKLYIQIQKFSGVRLIYKS